MARIGRQSTEEHHRRSREERSKATRLGQRLGGN